MTYGCIDQGHFVQQAYLEKLVPWFSINNDMHNMPRGTPKRQNFILESENVTFEI